MFQQCWYARLAELTDEELVLQARRGGRDATEELLARYRSLVESKARSYFLVGWDHDDVVQEGMIGLFKAIRDYRADRLAGFRAFADLCVTRQIISAIKRAQRQKHAPLNQYVPLDRQDPDDAALTEIMADERAARPESELLGHRLAEYLQTLTLSGLSELESRVIQCRLEGKSYQQMAAELHCPPKSVDNALQRAKRKLWNLLVAYR